MWELVGYRVTLDEFKKDAEQRMTSVDSLGRVLISPKAYNKIKKIIEKDIKKVPYNHSPYRYVLPFYLQPERYLKK